MNEESIRTIPTPTFPTTKLGVSPDRTQLPFKNRAVVCRAGRILKENIGNHCVVMHASTTLLVYATVSQEQRNKPTTNKITNAMN